MVVIVIKDARLFGPLCVEDILVPLCAVGSVVAFLWMQLRLLFARLDMDSDGFVDRTVLHTTLTDAAPGSDIACVQHLGDFGDGKQLSYKELERFATDHTADIPWATLK